MSKKKTPAWTPLVRAINQIPDWATDPVVAEKILSQEVYRNSRYTVAVYRTILKDALQEGELTHLSIKANDKSAHHDWRDLQMIKNELLGQEEEAVEIYPAESRLVDNANQYHLWSIKGYKIPFGFHERLVSEDSIGGSKQRVFDKWNRPKDLTKFEASDFQEAVRKGKA